MHINNYFKCAGHVHFFDDTDRASAEVAHNGAKTVQRSLVEKQSKYPAIVAWRQKTLPTMFLGMDGVSDPLEEDHV